MEVGLSFGGSALVFASSHRELGHAPRGQHVALDPYQEEVWDSCGLLALGRAGLFEYVDFRPAYSSRELPKLLEGGERFGLVYIDGSHLFEDVFVDAYYVARLLADGGVAAFDDISNPHVAKVIRFLRSNLSGALRELDMSVYRRRKQDRFIYRIARRLGKTQLTAFRRVADVKRKWDTSFHAF